MQKKLWYKNSAEIWEEALPIGNGRIGAMVYGGAICERLQINEDTLWSGSPNLETSKYEIPQLDQIRKWVADKEFVKASEATASTMRNYRTQGYVSYGNLSVDTLCTQKDVKEYRRELDMENGIVRAEYMLNGVKVVKRAFVSLVDDLMVLNIKSDSPFKYHIYQAIDLENKAYVKDEQTVVEGRCPTAIPNWKREAVFDERESIRFCSRVKVLTGAKQYFGGSGIWTDATKEITLLFSIKTSFNGFDKQPVTEGKEYIQESLRVLQSVDGYSYEELEKRHVKEYKKYFDRVELQIDGEDFSVFPTDERIREMAQGRADNELVTLLFDYSRYLTISSSMPGTQPANLQGIWSYHLLAPWNSNYTMNINTQMNYWATETCNLGECHLPLMAMLKDLQKKGNVLGLRGWASWHNSDIWRFNYPATSHPCYGFWPMGGIWACRHIWEHYAHTRDLAFLQEYYPVMVGAMDFLEDWLYEDENGELTTCPSTSPENSYVIEGKVCAVCKGSAMDISIIRDFLDKLIKATEALGKDAEHYKNVFAKLAKVKINDEDRILEWGEELIEAEPGHRHVSHLYGFYPADIMTDEKYTNAVRKSLQRRLEHGGGHTGWSNAWIAVLYARLNEGEKVMHHIRNMFAHSIYPNMFDAHPPFQIDGNFGMAAAICEALMQSHTGELQLIPAIPQEWKSGSVKGFVTRTGEIVDFCWEDGKATILNRKNIANKGE